MPEGDTLLRAANKLTRAIVGKVVTGYRSVLPEAASPDRVGRTVSRVEAHGKNLFVHFDDGRVLHSHLRMTGSWQVYRRGEPWRRPAREARVVIECGMAIAVCFNAPVLVMMSERRAEHVVADLGPDVLEEEAAFDPDVIVRRLRARSDLTIGEAVMHQGLLAGIGNIYKSETLFVCRVDPWAPMGTLSDEVLRAIVVEARQLMARNVIDPRMRSTRAGGGYFVYKRRGDPCRECGTTIEMWRQGDAGRSTYYCPQCQGAEVRRPRAGATRLI